jgi:hypothetical protein
MERPEAILRSANAKLSDRVFALDRKPRKLDGSGPFFSTIAGTKALEILLFDSKSHPYWTKLESLGQHLRRHAEVLWDLIESTPPPSSLEVEGAQVFSKKNRWLQAQAQEVLVLLEGVSSSEAFLVSESLKRKQEVGALLGGWDGSACRNFLLGVEKLLEVDTLWQRHVLEWKKKSAPRIVSERSVI